MKLGNFSLQNILLYSRTEGAGRGPPVVHGHLPLPPMVVCAAGMDGHSLQALLEGMDRQQIMELLNQGTLPFGSLAGLAGSSSSSRPSTGNQSRPDTAVTSQSQEPVSQSGGSRRTSGTSRSEQQHSESSQPSQPR